MGKNEIEEKEDDEAMKKEKKKEVKNEYEWIESSLKKIDGEFGVFNNSVIHMFRQHKVTDERLNDLSNTDWHTLIQAVGVRNEMKKLYKMKMNDRIKGKMNDEDKGKVRDWLQRIGFDIYLECFMINGFDSMEIIKGIDTKQELQSIGI